MNFGFFIYNIKDSICRNLEIQMSKVGKWESGKPRREKVAMKAKNNCEKTCTIQKLFVPLQHSCKNDIEQRKLRHNYRTNFS